MRVEARERESASGRRPTRSSLVLAKFGNAHDDASASSALVLRQQLAARYTSSPDVAMTALSLCSTYSPLDRALLGTKKVLPRSRSRLPTRRPRPAERSGHFCPRADTRTACALYALVQRTRKASVYTTTS